MKTRILTLFVLVFWSGNTISHAYDLHLVPYSTASHCGADHLDSDGQELSGVVASLAYPIYYFHDDWHPNGETSRYIHAADAFGNLNAKYRMPNEIPWNNRDPEDIFYGYCPPELGETNRCIGLADTGNNGVYSGGGSSVLSIFFIREPQYDPMFLGANIQLENSEVVEQRFRLPNGWKRDFEAVFYDHMDREVYAVSKRYKELFKIPVNIGTTVTALHEGNLIWPFPGAYDYFATGADMSADGLAIGVRNYKEGALYLREVGQTVASAMTEFPPMTMPVETNPNVDDGEALGFLYSPTSQFYYKDPKVIGTITVKEGSQQIIRKFLLPGIANEWFPAELNECPFN